MIVSCLRKDNQTLVQQLLIKEYRAGVLRQELADKYKISLSSVGRLLRKHEARLKDNAALNVH